MFNNRVFNLPVGFWSHLRFISLENHHQIYRDKDQNSNAWCVCWISFSWPLFGPFRTLRKFTEFWCLLLVSGARGKLIREKNLKSKISCQTLFNDLAIVNVILLLYCKKKLSLGSYVTLTGLPTSHTCERTWRTLNLIFAGLEIIKSKK